MAALRPFAFVVWTIGLVVMTSTACRYGPEVRGPFWNRYVDADRGQPVEGVVFLAVWHTVTPNLVSGGPENFYEAREAVSGADGRVEIPALTGPIWRIGLSVRFYEFVPGYGYASESAQVTSPNTRPYTETTVTLLRPLETRQERCKNAHRGSLIPSLIGVAPHTKMERYMAAVARERDELDCGSL